MTWYLGADPGSRHTGLAALKDDGTLRHQTVHPTGDMPDRLVFLRDSIRHWLAPLADEGCWCVVIEQPGTRFGGATLLAAYGVLVEACRSMLACPVMTLPSAQWKLKALGNGAAKKTDVMAGARLLGYEGADQDTADAICCADAARVLVSDQLRRDAA